MFISKKPCRKSGLFLIVIHLGNFHGYPCFMLKKEVISWIISKERDYEQGLSLLKQITPLDPLIQRPGTGHNQKELFTKLGIALKQSDFESVPTVKAAPSLEVVVKHESTPIPQLLSPAESLPGLSSSARLSLEISDHKKAIAHYQNKIVRATSDQQRKDLIYQADRVQDQIAYNEQLIKRLDAGEITEIPDKEVEKGEDPFEVPEDLYELANKISRLRSTRSKRSAKMKQLAASGEHNSPEYLQAVADFEQMDKAIRELDEHKKIRTKGGTPS